MKVVVYFRQRGEGTTQNYPLLTNWSEDDRGNVAPQHSFFDPARSYNLSAEIQAQINAVNEWLEANCGVVVGSFTEAETGSKHRPQFALAKKLAMNEQCLLLVATTAELAGQRFQPTTRDGLKIICLADPWEAVREQWSQSNDVVLYIRAPSDTDTAKDFLLKQQGRIGDLVRYNRVLAQFTEVESDSLMDRPQLRQALVLCRERKARLIIGTTDAIGGGLIFTPGFADVPFQVAYRKTEEWPDTIDVESCPFPMCLHFPTRKIHGKIPVYLVNGTTYDLYDVKVSSCGFTMDDGALIATTLSRKHLGTVAAKSGIIVEAYDVHFDGDFVVVFDVEAQLKNGTSYSGRAVTKGQPASNWLEVHRWEAAGRD